MPKPLAHLILAALVWAGAAPWSPGWSQEGAARQTSFTLVATRDADLALHLRWSSAPGT